MIDYTQIQHGADLEDYLRKAVVGQKWDNWGYESTVRRAVEMLFPEDMRVHFTTRAWAHDKCNFSIQFKRQTIFSVEVHKVTTKKATYRSYAEYAFKSIAVWGLDHSLPEAIEKAELEILKQQDEKTKKAEQLYQLRQWMIDNCGCKDWWDVQSKLEYFKSNWYTLRDIAEKLHPAKKDDEE